MMARGTGRAFGAGVVFAYRSANPVQSVACLMIGAVFVVVADRRDTRHSCIALGTWRAGTLGSVGHCSAFRAAAAHDVTNEAGSNAVVVPAGFVEWTLVVGLAFRCEGRIVNTKCETMIEIIIYVRCAYIIVPMKNQNRMTALLEAASLPSRVCLYRRGGSFPKWKRLTPEALKLRVTGQTVLAMARGMMIDRDALRVQSAAIADARILAELVYARFVGRALGVCSALHDYVFYEWRNEGRR